MKLLLAITLFCISFGNAAPVLTETTLKTEENEKEKKKNKGEKTSQNKNLHSLKKWRITIQYTNGTIISKTIVVSKNSNLSALETAFSEADKYLVNKKNVKEFSVSPVTANYVLLAGD